MDKAELLAELTAEYWKLINVRDITNKHIDAIAEALKNEF